MIRDMGKSFRETLVKVDECLQGLDEVLKTRSGLDVLIRRIEKLGEGLQKTASDSEKYKINLKEDLGVLEKRLDSIDRRIESRHMELSRLREKVEDLVQRREALIKAIEATENIARHTWHAELMEDQRKTEEAILENKDVIDSVTQGAQDLAEERTAVERDIADGEEALNIIEEEA